MHLIGNSVLLMLHLIQKSKYLAEFQVKKQQELSETMMCTCTWAIKISEKCCCAASPYALV